MQQSRRVGEPASDHQGRNDDRGNELRGPVVDRCRTRGAVSMGCMAFLPIQETAAALINLYDARAQVKAVLDEDQRGL